MLYGGLAGQLEVRARKGGSRTISGSFPYNSTATLSDGGRNGGRPKKERFAPGAFSYSIDVSELDINLLVGHDFNRVLASRNGGSLVLRDSKEALFFEATLPAEVAETTHAKDALALLGAGLIPGISIGFRIPPPSAVKEPETIEEEDPSQGRALIRTVHQALLAEISLVTRPAYDETTIEARCWQPTARLHTNRVSPRFRWR